MLTAVQILNIPEDQPDRLFTAADRVDAEYKVLAKKWHPDLGGDAKVLAHINVLKSKVPMVKVWRTFAIDDLTPGVLNVTTDLGKSLRIGYRRKHSFALGDIYTGGKHTTHLIDAVHQPLFDRAVERIKAITYKDDALRKGNEPYMPKIVSAFKAGDKLGLTVEKNGDQILLTDLLAHTGPLDPRHVAWIVSRTMSSACFFWLQRLVHCDFSPSTLYVCPEHHTVSPLGGWWFAFKEGETIEALPKRTVDAINPRTLRAKEANIGITLELIKALGRELLGDQSGAKLQFNRALPEAMVRWLLLPAGDQPIKDYKIWQDKILLDSFGPRKFTKLEVTEADVYNLAARAA